jgi:xanthine dehydrogenase accessory factor
MKDVLPGLKEWQAQGEEIALATVLRVERSAPRPAGARLGVTRSGRMVGSVSGGCVESDVVERAIQTLDSGKPAVVNYGIADELGFQVGLSCGGSIDVLIEPFQPDSEWVALAQAVEAQQPAVYAIGLAPESLLGRKLTMLPAGESVGTIAPGLDGLLADAGDLLLQTGGAKLVTLPWEGPESLENIEAQVFLEAFTPPPSMVIVGATHTAISLSRLAEEVGFQVTVVDARSVLATEERFPSVHQLIRSWPDEALAQVSLGSHSYVVVLTHDPKFDIPALSCALRSDARYIGVQGSRVTHEARKVKLREEGFTEADLERIRAPVGLDIGSRTPAELAVAILAEMLAVRYGRL